jgi:ABC-type branched-subunit amino acid transport system substrate-binding protein
MSVNRRGGIAGRKVRLDLYESGGTPEGYLDAVAEACARDFAIVGSFSAFDAPTTDVDCGDMPDLPVEVTVAERSSVPNAYAAFPRQPDIHPVGAYRYLRDAVDSCCGQFMLVPNEEPARTRTLARIDAAVAIGFDSVGQTDILSDDPEAYAEYLAQIEAVGATFVETGGGMDSVLTLRRAAEGRAADVAVWYCDAECYDTAFLTEGDAAVEGQYVAIETAPFSDRSEIPALRAYYRSTTREDETPTYAGLRAYVTGLLFERAAKAVVDSDGDDGLTRARLLEALSEIHDFDAKGIVGPTDVGARVATGCYVLLQVQGGGFERLDPAEVGAVSCGDDNLVVSED